MTTERRWALRAYHLISATVLGLFVVIHLINHIVGISGQAQHIAFMNAVRPLYRNPIVEPVLLALFASQMLSGMMMVVRGWRARQGLVAWLQACSGIYLAAFVTLHVIAVLSGRVALGLDTDFRFAAAGFHVLGWPWYFWPYYTLAILALFVHVGCAIYWNMVDRNAKFAQNALRTMAVIGAALGLLIVSALAGKLYPVDIPARYKATYTGV